MSSTNQVRAINFKPISEDDHFRETRPREAQDKLKPEVYELAAKGSGGGGACKAKNVKNFSFEYTYPAVIFDNVCFSVDRSSQQSNFLNEVICRLSSCVDFSTSFRSQSSSPSEDKNKVQILKSVNLNVPYGSIFGLLGPSSCGKTTLLRCLVGLLEQTSGSIRLFGHNSETKRQEGLCSCKCGEGKARAKCQVPGANVGYMPQDLGLYEDFSISQLLTMFGKYMAMDDELIGTRIKFMSNFLDLPDVNRQIASLSGGQKRRVSFAVACLHMPPLIILDEPTVGVDPLLRQSIWKYLRRLADEENKTIIITTHYIEEAAQADQVALMRAGEILVQDTPKRIMELNGSRSLEEAFLKICNNVSKTEIHQQRLKLYPQPAFNWHDKLEGQPDHLGLSRVSAGKRRREPEEEEVVRELKQRAQEKLDLFDLLYSERNAQQEQQVKGKLNEETAAGGGKRLRSPIDKLFPERATSGGGEQGNLKSSLKGKKLILNEPKTGENLYGKRKAFHANDHYSFGNEQRAEEEANKANIVSKIQKLARLSLALLYKNYRRNVNSLPLLAFQFLLPIVQMISFSLCVGGRPTNIGLGLVNHDQLPLLADTININNNNLLLNITSPLLGSNASGSPLNELSEANGPEFEASFPEELLSDSYLSFIDTSMITVKPYASLAEALADVRQAKLWAAMEIGANFTTTILRRFDLENFYQLDTPTIKQSVIKIYPDRSNKVLDMICQRSLMNSYRKFLLNTFEHFKRLPIEVKEPIFEIEPNLISNSIDGYTESIAAGLLASLTYIMAAGLTTFIMVVERGNGVLERTYTSGINPVAYLLAHALFRSMVMMLQIGLVMVLTFYVLKQPLVGSVWLAYFVLMTLNLTGISYGLLISSIVTDQNGAALTIVSSLVVKITMSGILWPFEAIPRWLRVICYAQPLTMPVQALKAITLKGAGLADRPVQLGLFVSLAWLLLFLTIAAKRFKFYQH